MFICVYLWLICLFGRHLGGEPGNVDDRRFVSAFPDLLRLVPRFYTEFDAPLADFTHFRAELRRLAGHYMRLARRDHTLQVSPLVNEA